MARYHTTPSGNVAFTAEEETARDAEEKAWADGKEARDWLAIRNKRNALLVETDWWASSDLTMSDAQKKYRTDLRNLPSTVSDPSTWEDITWPTKPS
jgi:hypothetical protein